MAGLDPQTPYPTAIVQHQQSKNLEVTFADGGHFMFPFEFLRVFSPSAEVRGHHPSQQILQTGKKNVGIEQIEQVGHYAIKIRFSDGHDTGLYSWDYLYHLGREQENLWKEYLAALAQAGASREEVKAS